MEILTFKIKLRTLDNRLERTIVFSSCSLVSSFSYAILSSFNAEAKHLFNVEYKRNRFEFIFDNMEVPEWTIYCNPSLYKLSELNLAIGDNMVLEYDYGASFIFDIKLIDIKPMKKYTHRHYPYITSGKGHGIIEDMPPDLLLKVFEEDRGMFGDRDYNNFDISFANLFLKDHIRFYKEAYEHNIVNYEKKPLVFNTKTNEDSNIIDFEVNKLWLSIPEEMRNIYLKSVFCHNCFSKYGGVAFKPGYKIVKERGMLVIDGECEKCNGHIKRACD